ncbi:MAG: LysR family transcriptional regulator [Granulosicoccus sp.]
MELQQIRYFLALAENLNFTRAAEHCGVSQPSLTRAIKRMEEELGGQLILRERNNTNLTELGRRIKPTLEQALSLTEIVRDEANDVSRLSTDSLSIGVMCTIGPNNLISLVDHLGSEFPQLSLTVRTSTGQEIIDWLRNGKIDVAIVGMPNYPEEITVLDLYQERYMVAFPPGHRFANKESISLRDLEGERYLERLNCEYMEFFHSALSDQEPSLNRSSENSLESMDIRHESEHEDWIQAMIVAGLGCAIIPQYMSLYSELQMRPIVEPEIKRTIGIATVQGRTHAPIVKYFSNLCQKINWGSDLKDQLTLQHRAGVPNL